MSIAQIEIDGSPVHPGERVVYPNGGICRVQGVETKSIAGQSLVMLMLQREEDEATVMVPQAKVGTIGLRKVATAEAIGVLFEYFSASSADPELDWKVRHRENFERMAAGGLLDTAQVLKGLHALAQLRPLPQKEREMYDSARHQLVGEIAASLNLPLMVAENHIDYVLSPPPGSGREAPKDAPLDLKALRRTLGGKRRIGGARGDQLDLGEEEGEEEEEEAAALSLGVEDVRAARSARVPGLDFEDEEEEEEPEEEAAAAGGAEEEEEEEPARKPAKKTAAKKTVTKKVAAKKKAPVTSAAAAAKEPARAAGKVAESEPKTTTKKPSTKAVTKKVPAKKAATKKVASVATKAPAKSAGAKKAPAGAATAKAKKTASVKPAPAAKKAATAARGKGALK